MILLKIVNLSIILYTINCSDSNDFELKQIYHHGAKYPQLFRSLSISREDILLRQKKHKTPLLHTIRTISSNSTVQYTTGERQTFFSKHPPKVLPDVTDQGTVLSFAKMASNAYIEPEKDSWYDLGPQYNFNRSLGWKGDGIRVHLFANKMENTVILAFKGTSAGVISGDSPTSAKDKMNDNLLFSCCCAHVDSTWRTVCDCYDKGYTCRQNCLENSLEDISEDIYFFAAQAIVRQVEVDFPASQILLTGHSLGGGLSGLLGLAFGFPTVTFQSPGDMLPAKRLHLPLPTYAGHQVPYIWHFGHNADPIYMGECKGILSACYITGYALESKCHTGYTCVYDTRKNKKWGMDILKHRIGVVIEEVISQWDGVPSCYPEEDCTDCVLWNFI